MSRQCPTLRGVGQTVGFQGAQTPDSFKRGSGLVERAIVGRAERL